MAQLSAELFAATSAIFIAIFLICRCYMSVGKAYTVSVIKVSVPLLYFAYCFDGTWTFVDDWSYLSGGRELLQAGFDPIRDLWSPRMWREIQIMAGGSNTLYYWWNALAQGVFGFHYWAPVLFNVVATVVCGLIAFFIACRIGYDQIRARWIGTIVTLHWEIVAWSSFMNLKDCLVALLTLVSLWGGLVLVDARADVKACRLTRAALVAVVLAVVVSLIALSHLRFYVVALYVLAVAIWILLFRLSFWRLIIATGLCVVCIELVQLRLTGNLEHVHLADAAYGWLRFMVTPRPWGTEPAYSFLVVPSVLTWLTFPALLYGAWTLAKDSRGAGLLVTYAGVVTGFYGVVPLLQGPRHRLQLVPIFAIFAFEGIRKLIEKRKRHRAAYLTRRHSGLSNRTPSRARTA